jgi:hypothetical protein
VFRQADTTTHPNPLPHSDAWSHLGGHGCGNYRLRVLLHAGGITETCAPATHPNPISPLSRVGSHQLGYGISDASVASQADLSDASRSGALRAKSACSR